MRPDLSTSRWRTAAASALAALLATSTALLAGTPAFGEESDEEATTPSVTVTVLAQSFEAGVDLRVDGEGFNPHTTPGDAGVYAGVAPAGGGIDLADPDATAAFIDAAWVRPDQFSGDAFRVQLHLPTADLDPAVEYAVYTWQAHGYSNPSQDTETAIAIDWSKLTDPGEEAPGEEDPGETDPGETDPDETDPGTPGPTDPAPEQPEPKPSSPDPDVDGQKVDGAVFRWGVSNQSNARSHNPAAINLLSAGVADPGRGGVHIKREHWSARAGKVTIEKPNAKGEYRRATWAGLGTSPTGETIGPEGPFSGHTVVFRDGVGEVDRASGDARIRWKGTFSVVYYGGNTIFTVSDPELVLAGGEGEVRATLGGFLADRNDPLLWKPAPTTRATIATLTGVKLRKKGATVQPLWDGVRVVGSEPQDRSGPQFGAFPQEMVTYLKALNTDQFWYSTGLSTDVTKRPLPIYLSWTPEEITPAATTEQEQPAPTVQNAVRNPLSLQPPLLQPPLLPGGPALAVPGVPTGASGPIDLATPPANIQLVAAPATAPTRASSDERWLWIGGLCLLLAALLFLAPQSTARRS